MLPTFEVVTLVVFFVATVGVSAFRVKTWKDDRNDTHGYVDVVVKEVTYPLGRTCFNFVPGSAVATFVECLANLRVCLFTNTTTNLTEQQRHLHKLCRPGNGIDYPSSNDREVRGIESQNILISEQSRFAFYQQAGELPFVGAFPQEGWLNLVVSVGLVKQRRTRVSGTATWHPVLRHGLGTVVSTRLSNDTTSGSQRVVVPNAFCASSAVLRNDCEPLLTFNITWRVRCAPGFYPLGRCSMHSYNMEAMVRRPRWGQRSLFPQSHWRHSKKRYIVYVWRTVSSNRTRNINITVTPRPGHSRPLTRAASDHELVTKSSSKGRSQSKIAVALGIPVALISVALIAWVIGYIVSRYNKTANGYDIRGGGRVFFKRMTSKSAPFLDSESFPEGNVDSRDRGGSVYTPHTF